MHIIRHLKGKQCIFTRHASLCAQTGAISAETGEKGCIVIDCYKRLPSSRSISLFQNCIWCIKAPKEVLSAPRVSTDVQFATQLPRDVVWSLSPRCSNSLCSHEGEPRFLLRHVSCRQMERGIRFPARVQKQQWLWPPERHGLNDNDIQKPPFLDAVKKPLLTLLICSKC